MKLRYTLAFLIMIFAITGCEKGKSLQESEPLKKIEIKTITVACTATLHVPLEYSTIQAAIDAAGHGDTILVADGIYTGEDNKNLTWDGNEKHITVKSENGLDNCIIDCENDGRGFYFDNTNQNDSDIIDGFTIRNGIGSGAGIYCKWSSSPTITNCTITENRCNNNGGGISCYAYSSPTITNCVISGNTSNNNGGGIYCWSSSPTIANCTITENRCNNNGSGVSCYAYSSPTITNCVITGNTSNDNGGGIYGETRCYSTITNCTIAGNTADYGGGICTDIFSFPTITNCTIAGNTADYGGGIYCKSNSFPTIFNSVLWNNSAPNGTEIASDISSGLTISYSDVAGGEAGAYVESGCPLNWGSRNISSDPLFMNATIGNYHLSPGSPCIDVANSSIVHETDQDGRSRYDDPDTPNGPEAGSPPGDMGAYEYLLSPIALFSSSLEKRSFNPPYFDGFWCDAQAPLRLDEEIVYHGRYSLRLEKNIYPGHKVAILLSQRFQAKPSRKYRITFWVKGKKAAPLSTEVMFSWWNSPSFGKGKWVHDPTGKIFFPGGTFDWRCLETAVSPPLLPSTYLQVEILSSQNEGTYWIDFLKLEELPLEKEQIREEELLITSLEPQNGATNVPLKAKIKVTFSEPLEEESLKKVIFTLSRAEEALPLIQRVPLFPVFGTLKYNPLDYSLNFIPEKPFYEGSRYLIWIKGGPRGIKSQKGNFFEKDQEFVFSTFPEKPLEKKYPEFKKFMEKVAKGKKAEKEIFYTPFDAEKLIFNMWIESGMKIKEGLLQKLWDDIPPEVRDNFALQISDGEGGDRPRIEMSLEKLEKILDYADKNSIRLTVAVAPKSQQKLIMPQILDRLMENHPSLIGVTLPEEMFGLYGEAIHQGKPLFTGRAGKEWKEYLNICQKHKRFFQTSDPAASPQMHQGLFIDQGVADYLHNFASTYKPSVKMNCFFTDRWQVADSILYGGWLSGWFDRKSGESEFWGWIDFGFLRLGEKVKVAEPREVWRLVSAIGDWRKAPHSFWSIQWAREAISGANFFDLEIASFCLKVVGWDEDLWKPGNPPLFYTPGTCHEPIDDFYKFARFLLNNKVVPDREELRKQTKVVLKYTGQKDIEMIRKIVETLEGKNRPADFLCPGITRYGIIAVIPDPEKFPWVNTWDAKVLDPSKVSIEEIVKFYNKYYPPQKSTAYVLKTPYSLFIASPEENTEAIYKAEEKLGRFRIKTEVNADKMFLFSVDRDKLSFYTHGRPCFISELEITLPYSNSKVSVSLEGVKLPIGKSLYQYEKIGENRIKVKFLHGKHSLVAVVEPVK